MRVLNFKLLVEKVNINLVYIIEFLRGVWISVEVISENRSRGMVLN